MTSAAIGEHSGTLLQVAEEIHQDTEESELRFKVSKGKISSDLNIGADVTTASLLKANEKICNRGVQLIGSGFIVTPSQAYSLGLGSVPETEKYIRRYRNGKDLTSSPRDVMVIDLFGLSEQEVVDRFPAIYQWVLERVKPEREQNNRKSYRDKWWVFGEPVVTTRNAIQGLERYIVTCRTAKHRVFSFLESDVVPDAKLITIGLDDSYFLGVLSSIVHVSWAIRSGGWLGAGNDSNYNHSECFNKFSFPDVTPAQKQKIRDLGDRLDAHRKQVQAQHPDITITGMYNLLEKLRRGEPFTDADRAFNSKALVSTLKQIHDELDVAVLEAYGWEDLIPLLSLSLAKPQAGADKPSNVVDFARPTPFWLQRQLNQLGKIQQKEGINVIQEMAERNVDGKVLFEEIILERLVALNAERAEEERNGYIPWLRPDYQAPGEVQVQQTITGMAETTVAAIEPAEQRIWSKQPKEQLAAIQELLSTSRGEWTVEQLAAQFKGGNRAKKAILDNLERLEFFGYVLCRTDNSGMTRWQFGEMQKAA